MNFLNRLSYTLAILGIAAILATGLDTIRLMQPAVDLYDADWDDLENGMHVSVEVDLVWDCIISETRDGNESARYYAIPSLVCDDESIMLDRLIGVKVTSSSDMDTMENILDETNDWWFDETGDVGYGYTTLYIDGILCKMDDEEESFMREYVEDSLTDPSEDAEDYYVPYYIAKRSKSTCLGTTIIGFVLLAAGVVLIIRDFKKKKEDNADMLYRPNANNNIQRDYYGSGNVNNTTFPNSTYPSNSTYQSNSMYGNANETTFGSSNMGGGTGAAGAPQMWETDPNTGLSKDFLQRSAQEHQPKPEAPKYDMGTNPLYGTKPDGDK